jgi:hypothetical protein
VLSLAILGTLPSFAALLRTIDEEAMTGEHLEMILKNAQTKVEKDGFANLPDGSSLTLYIAHDGVSLTVPRVEAVKVEGELVFARTAKGERFSIGRSDLFAVAVDGAATGAPVRRAGFG